MLVSASVTKIRRLIRDENSKVFTADTKLLNLFGRVQQEFAKDTRCMAKVVALLAPPHGDYAVTHQFEEGYLAGSSVFNPFFRNSTQSGSQPFELTEDYNLAADGTTVTCGADVERVDPQHPVPFFLPGDYYSPMAILWNYKWIEQKGFDSVDLYYLDGWHEKGNVVDVFAQVEALSKKAIVTKGIPYDVGEMLGSELFDNPSFESIDANPFRGWDKTTPGDGAISVEETAVHSGSRACKISSNSSGSSSRVYQTISLESGKSYKFSTRTRGDGTTGGRYTVTDYISNAETGIVGTEYSEFSYSFKCTSTASKIVYLVGGNLADAVVYFDSCSFKEILGSEVTAVDTSLAADLLHVIYHSVPERPTATTNTIEMQDPFVKYIEFRVASRLLKIMGPLKDPFKSMHLEQRYRIGVGLVKRMQAKLAAETLHQLGSEVYREGTKPALPRLPDHYPKMRLR